MSDVEDPTRPMESPNASSIDEPAPAPGQVVVEGSTSLAEMDPLQIARVGEGNTLLQVRGLKKHFPIVGGLLKRQIGTVFAVDGVTSTSTPARRSASWANPVAARRRWVDRSFA